MYAHAARLFPGHQGVDRYGIHLAVSRGDFDSADARARAFRDRHAETPLDRAAASRELAGIVLARGRLAEAERYTRDAMAANVEAGRPAEYLTDAAVLGFTDIWFRRQPARGLRTVEAALARQPMDSIKLLQRPYLTLAVLYASAVRPQQARALLTQYERGVDPRLRRIDEPKRRWAWGQVAMAEGRFADAIAEFQGFLPTPRECLPCGQAALAQAYDRAGHVDSAIAVYERYVTTPSMFRTGDQGIFAEDPTQLAPACKRLGELYEQRGDRAKAKHYYSRFVELWKDSDPELRPAVIAVQQRLRQLGGENSEVH